MQEGVKTFLDKAATPPSNQRRKRPRPKPSEPVGDCSRSNRSYGLSLTPQALNRLTTRSSRLCIRLCFGDHQFWGAIAKGQSVCRSDAHGDRLTQSAGQKYARFPLPSMSGCTIRKTGPLLIPLNIPADRPQADIPLYCSTHALQSWEMVASVELASYCTTPKSVVEGAMRLGSVCGSQKN